MAPPPARPLSVWWPPLLSAALPGFDQWRAGEYRSAAVYSGYATAGAILFLTNPFEKSDDYGPVAGDRERNRAFGSQAMLDAGFLSAFHSFRRAAETHKPRGEYLFLAHEETAGDLLLAPFHVENFIKPSVFIPLVAIAAIVSAQEHSDTVKYDYQGRDIAYATGNSLNAGIGEEAFFRGYMMPVLRQSWGSEFWSNAATSVIFGAAHLGAGNPFPWPQALLGFYLGWRVQHNEYQLSQAVFIHTWWDIIAISASLAYNRGEAVSLPVFKAQF